MAKVLTGPRVQLHNVRRHIVVLEMHGGPQNPLDLKLVEGIADHLDLLAADHEVRAVVLCSAGKHFCAGALSKLDVPAPTWSTEALYGQIPRIAAFPKPLLAALHGASIGGGAGLALLADWRQMAHDARIQCNFSLLGYSPGFAISRTLPDIVGPQKARELLMTGRPVNSTEAVSIGLADAVSDPDSVLSDTIDRASSFVRAAPLAVSAIKNRLRSSLLADLPAVLREELEDQRLLKETDDYSEGIAAMRQRRAAEFQGR